MSRKDGGLRQMLRQYMPSAQWTTIETAMVAHGVPDNEYCFAGGVQGWLELKWTDGWAVTVRPDQVAWIHRRYRQGGRVWVMVRRQRAISALKAAADELWLVHGRDVETLQVRGLRGVVDSLTTGSWHGGPSAWRWDQIEERLRS